MADFTYRGSLVANAIKEFLDVRKESLGVLNVFYGDQSIIPDVPAICVEPALTTRQVSGMPYQTDNTFTINVLVYHTSLEGMEGVQQQCDVVTESVEDALNTESIPQQFAGGSRFGGIVLHGHTTRLEYGYKVMSNKLMRCNRIIWQGVTKTRLVE